MALHFSGGIGTLYDMKINQPIAKISYQLIETDPTQYSKKKWWGEFNSNKAIKESGTFRIELEDGRKGECIVSVNVKSKGIAAHHHYHFNGRGKLGRGYGR